MQQLSKLATAENVKAIGECGIDKLKSGASVETQIETLKAHIRLSEQLKKPLILHIVKGQDIIMRLHKETRPTQAWIIHGFRGKEALAKEFIQHGFYLSFGACYQEEALRSVPVERLFIETDESELSIEDIYLRVAQSRGMDLKELTESIKKNVERVFFKH